jgi:fido (protein-threonine AMPylation protein)
VNPYIDEATGTHFNKLGIRSRDELHQVEYAVTDLRIAELLVKPIPGRMTSTTSKQCMPTSSKTCTSGPAKSAR